MSCDHLNAAAAAAPRALLLVQLHHLGDVVLTTPAIRAARLAFPAARLDFLTGPLGAEVLRHNPHIDNLHVLARGSRAAVKMATTLMAAHYDAVVDFHSTPRTALLVAATAARTRAGIVGRGPRNRAYTHLVPREPGPVYMALQKLRLLTPLGIEPTIADLSVEVALDPTDRAWARETFEQRGLSNGEPVAAMSVVSRQPYKQWGADRWAEVADRLVAAGARVVLTNGPGEEDQVEAVVSRMRHAATHGFDGITVGRLAALYERCGVWLGNDGGPKHLAVAAGAPTITVIRWGLGSVWTDTRAGSPHVAIEALRVQGCDRSCKRCDQIGCLRSVSAAQVADAAIAVLSRTPSQRGHSIRLHSHPHAATD